MPRVLSRLATTCAVLLMACLLPAGEADSAATSTMEAITTLGTCDQGYVLLLDQAILVPRNADGEVISVDAVKWTLEPLTLHLYVGAGTITAGWGQVAGYLNPITFDVSRLRSTETGFSGLVLGVRFEDTAPMISERIEISASIAEGRISGSFTGSTAGKWGAYSIVGKLKKAMPLQGVLQGVLQGQVITLADLQQRNAVDPAAAWPWWRGPSGNGVATPFVGQTVDSKDEIRLCWKSESWIPMDCNDHAYGRGDKVSNSFTGPVVADGRVYCAMKLPAPDGPLDQAAETRLAPDQLASTGSPLDRRHLYHHAAMTDDVITATDASSGRSLWQTVIPLTGLKENGYLGNLHVSPLAHAGKVYVTASLGRILCLDGQTGSLEWERPLIPTWKEAFEKMRAGLIGRRFVKPFQMGDVQVNMALVDGVLICNTCADHKPWQRKLPGYQERADALFGLDPGTGAILWGPVQGCISGRTSPICWHWQGGEYVLTGQACLEAKTGRILWKQDLKANDLLAPVVCGQSADGSAAILGFGSDGFLVTPIGRSAHWKIAGVYGSDKTAGAMLKGFYVYFGMTNEVAWTKGEKKYYFRGWNVIDPVTGVLISSNKSYSGHEGAYADLQVANDLLIKAGKAFGGSMVKLSDDGKTVTEVADLSDISSCVASPNAICDGRLFVRGEDGLMCFDIRKPPTGTSE